MILVLTKRLDIAQQVLRDLEKLLPNVAQRSFSYLDEDASHVLIVCVEGLIGLRFRLLDGILRLL